MTMHVVGYELSGSEAALTALTPIPDGTVAVSGNDIRVPVGMANISWAAAMINSATATLRAQVQTPYLRSVLNFDIDPIRNGLTFGDLPASVRLWQNPLGLAELEPMDVFVQNGAAVMNRAFVALSDGPTKPVNGRIFTVRCTVAAALATATWANSALTFGQSLPAGRYQCVGAHYWSANACAFRLFPVGGAWRPGGLAGATEADRPWADFRYGNNGVWFEFDNVTPPSIDVMGITDTSGVAFLDLIKIK